MLKRKYGNRRDWKRLLKKEYRQSCLNTSAFKGYITLLKIDKVTAPLFSTYGQNNVCIVDDGYMWLQQFPSEKNHAVTTMFNSDGEVVQWYIDICLMNGIDNGGPYMEDLFLDIIVLPTGEIIQKDAEELEEALLNGIIDENLYKMARKEALVINHSIENGTFDLLKQAEGHKDLLLQKLF